MVLDLAEFGHDTAAVVHHLLTGDFDVKLHDRPMLTGEELDLMEAVLGSRKSLSKGSRCNLADALRKCTAELQEGQKMAAM